MRKYFSIGALLLCLGCVTTADEKKVKVHEAPAFRGQRDVIEKRTEIRMATKQQTAPEKKDVNVVSELSSKEGDDFDVEW